VKYRGKLQDPSTKLRVSEDPAVGSRKNLRFATYSRQRDLMFEANDFRAGN
jgi:hypothetical protein